MTKKKTTKKKTSKVASEVDLRPLNLKKKTSFEKGLVVKSGQTFPCSGVWEAVFNSICFASRAFYFKKGQEAPYYSGDTFVYWVSHSEKEK